MKKRLLLAALICALPTAALAQNCSGLFNSGNVCANSTATSPGIAASVTVSALFDRVYGSTQSQIIYRGVSSWQASTTLPTTVQDNITRLGTVSSGTWNAGVIGPLYGGTGVANNAANILTWSGAFAATFTLTGATGVTFPTSGTLATTAGASIPSGVQGDLLYFSAANVLSTLAKNTSATRYLSNGGTSNNSSWAQIDLTTGVTGLLPLANGGTNANLTASNGGLAYSTASALAILSGTATAGQIPRSGSSAAPSWSTATYPATTAAGTVLASSSANTIAGTATPTLGVAGSLLGTLSFAGNSSGTVIVTPQNAAGTPTLTLPTNSGTFAATATSPVVLNSTTGTLTCPTCVTSSGGGAISGTAPIAVSAAGVVSINAPYVTLTASNGGIVYSGATNLAILSGTATANQMLLSGASTTPAWSTLTMPTTAAAGTMLAAATSNTVAATATPTLGANSGTGGQITFNGSTSGSVALRVAAAAGTGTIVQLPSTNGNNGEVLSTNGSGVTSWIAAGGTGTVTSVTPSNGLASTITAAAPGGAITTTGTLYGAEVVNAQTGTSYAILDGDRGKLITTSNAAAQAYSIAQAGAASAFQSGWYVDISNISTNPLGLVTVTPATSTINGAATLVVGTGQSARIISDGTNYQVAALTGVRVVKIQVFASSGTYTPSAGMKYAIVECVGGGGGGGGGAAAAAVQFAIGGGGGGGGYAYEIVTAAAVGASKTVTIGAAGTGATAGANTGGTGGTTSVGSLCVASGGVGGTGGASGTSSSAVAAGAGGAGGVGTTGSTLLLGGVGGTAIWVASPIFSQSGGGGAAGGGFAPFTPGSAGVGTGVTGALYGGGGGGGASYNGGGAAAGGPGAAGYVKITEFCTQ